MRTLIIALLAACLGLGAGLAASALFNHATTTTRTVTITYHDGATTPPQPPSNGAGAHAGTGH